MEATVTISLKELDELRRELEQLRDFKKNIENGKGYRYYQTYYGGMEQFFIEKSDVLDAMENDIKSLTRDKMELYDKISELKMQVVKKKWYKFWE